jgi:hypothetical protein
LISAPDAKARHEGNRLVPAGLRSIHVLQAANLNQNNSGGKQFLEIIVTGSIENTNACRKKYYAGNLSV